MKKILMTAFLVLVIPSLHAQDINDALRYAQTDLNGTARFRSMSGAFGALGGDLSSLNINPAGSVVFANSQVGFTISSYNTANKSNYFGTNTSDSRNSFDINQGGVVLAFNNYDKKSNWKKFALALNYENNRNLDNALFSAGTNPLNSVDNYFLSYANGVSLGTLNNYYFDELYYNEQQAYLGYNSYIIDPSTNSSTNTTYYTNIATGGNYYQENKIRTKGYNGKLNFNFATQYTDQWSFGLNLNSHFIDYRQSSSFFETNDNPKYPTGSTVDVVHFYNDLYTYGNGFSFQLGTIYKVTKQFRVGFSYESPTWYRLNDELTQRVTTSGYGLNSSQNNTQYGTIVTDPNTTMIFQPYSLKSPSKTNYSFAYIFGKKGLLSLDLSRKDYSKTMYKPKSDFPTTNSILANSLTVSNEVRLGGEYKIKNVSLRGGYRWEGSPYKDKNIMSDLNGYSCGFGYNFGSIKLDVSYSNSKREYNQQFFSQGLTDAAKIKSVNNNISLTMLFEL
ncbi:OmpP1/FadL family transporter [Flavobacterium aciduliphilum]|nr:outer membrane protein transport protein [Flavobacterium aciduliphilum]